MMEFMRRCGHSCIEFNLFETDATDAESIHIQRWSTRVYIFVLFSSMLVILLNRGLHVETQLVSVKNPSFESYLKLQQAYNDISCLCSKVSASYRSFVELNITYDSICSSSFVSQTWIKMLVNNMTTQRYVGDFRASATFIFQVLQELCHRSQSVLDTDTESFYDTQFISNYLINEHLLRTDIKIIIDEFLINSYSSFNHSISFLRSFMRGNVLMSGIGTTALTAFFIENNVYQATVVPRVYGSAQFPNGCMCDKGDQCAIPSGFYDSVMLYDQPTVAYFDDQTPVSFVMKSWFVACWALNALLISSVENSFLYNQTAFNLIAMHYNWPSNSIFPSILNSNELNQTSKDRDTFYDHLQTLFVKNSSIHIDYSLYYAQCQPRSCTYSAQQKASFLYLFTLFLALYGGLSVPLQFLIPFIIAFLIQRLRRSTKPSVNVGSSTTTEISKPLWERVKKMTEFVWCSIMELNLFQSSLQREPSDLKQQRYTTKIYILCLIIALVNLILYTMLIGQTKLIQVDKPSLETVHYLQSQSEFNSSLRCRCTKINAPYKELVTLQPFYHQMCLNYSLLLIWESSVRALRMTDGFFVHREDFRFSYELFFLLNELCQVSNEMIVTSLQTFKQTQLVTDYLLSRELFINQMNATVKQFQSELPVTFFRFAQLVRNITYVNQIFSFLNNVQFKPIGSPPHAASFSINGFQGIKDNTSYTCSCANDINCKTEMRLFRIFSNLPTELTVPGLYQTCFMFESLLQSTFECFYDDQDCLPFIVNFYNQSWFRGFTLFNSSIPSRFARNSTINSISSELFIEYWNQSLNYSSYFAHCLPASCSYKIVQRNNLFATITIIIGLIGGLSVSLRILVPIVVAICFYLIRRRQQQQPTFSESITIRTRLQILIAETRNWLARLNAFNNPKQTTAHYIQQQQRATYVYLVLLFTGLIILLIYNSLVNSTATFTITSPSLKQYQELQQDYGAGTIDCPCSQLSIRYSSFIEFDYSFHAVCSSPFISHTYLQEFFLVYNSLNTDYAKDNAFTLKGTIFSHFQALLILCNLVKDGVNDARQKYLSSTIISASMIDYNLFDKQTNASLSHFQSTLPNKFLNNLRLIRGMTQSNGLVSLYSTNWYPLVNDWIAYQTVYMEPQYYDNCSCFTSSACTQPSVPFIQGYLVGCTPLEGLLRSSIECLYEQDCIAFFTSHLNLSLPTPVPLKINETRFLSNATVDSIVEQMFIETYSSNVSYNKFFEQCNPTSCTVTLTKRHTIVTIITTLLGLCGGLTTFLRLLVPFLTSSIYKLIEIFKRRFNTQIQPFS